MHHKIRKNYSDEIRHGEEKVISLLHVGFIRHISAKLSAKANECYPQESGSRFACMEGERQHEGCGHSARKCDRPSKHHEYKQIKQP